MFEKEAEEYTENPKSAWKQGMTCVGSVRQAFKEGAEFGYNKANEWHYVKDGDLPPLNTNVLVIHRWARTPEVGKRIEVFINSSVWVWAMCSDRYRYTSDDENVIAWKEIVLPLDDGKLRCALCSKPCQPHELGTLTITYKDIGKTEKHLVCLECGKKLGEQNGKVIDKSNI